jgi:hypothetical protein
MKRAAATAPLPLRPGGCLHPRRHDLQPGGACGHRETDRYGRMVAVCVAGGIDLGRWMVQQGHALAYRKYSLDYVADENVAKAARAGLWRANSRTRLRFDILAGRPKHALMTAIASR